MGSVGREIALQAEPGCRSVSCSESGSLGPLGYEIRERQWLV